MVDLRTGAFVEGDHRVTMSAPAAFARLDYPTPDVDAFFTSVFNADQEIISFLNRLLGYGVTGHNSEQAWAIFWGAGGNGKGILQALLEKTLGVTEYYVAMHHNALFQSGRPAAAGQAEPHLAMLERRRIGVLDESGAGQTLDDTVIKRATGGNGISARDLHGTMRTFTPTHLPILLTNHKPAVDVDDRAMLRRLILVPFSNVHKKAHEYDPTNSAHRMADQHLADRLVSEEGKRQFLVWLVRGAVAWYQQPAEQGLGQKPAVARAAEEEYLAENDLLGDFIGAHCKKEAASRVKTADFRDSFCRATESAISPSKLKKAMHLRGFEYDNCLVDGVRARVFKGLCFKEHEELELEAEELGI